MSADGSQLWLSRDGASQSTPLDQHADGADGVFAELAQVAAAVACVTAAVVEYGSHRGMSGPYTPTHGAFHAEIPLHADARQVGTIRLMNVAARHPFTPEQEAGLGSLVDVIVRAGAREQELRRMREVNRRAARADVILKLVSEAVSCTDALTSLLGELCRHHGAIVGRIWRLVLPEDAMLEVSRFNEGLLGADTYYRRSPNAPIHSGNSFTAEVIRSNKPGALIYSKVDSPDRFALLCAAMDAGLASQVSFPFWVQDQRFGISLAFTTEREDLDAIVADVGSLANTIRPALFRKVTEEQIRHMAHHDELTQLGNRLLFNERLQAAIDDAATPGGPRGLALLYLDLDGFKLINDMRGHAAGDNVLVGIAERLRAGVRQNDTVARIGGDEFAVIQVGSTQADAIRLAERLLDRVRDPFSLDGQRSTVGMSIGVATYPEDGLTADELLRNADAALYDAKRAGRNTYRIYDPHIGVRQRERVTIERDLEAALHREDFSLAFQPICQIGTRRVVGLEALLRWTHPVRGPQSPATFIPIAETSGRILPLGRWVLETACAEAASWADDICLSVNFSPLQFRQPGLVDTIASVLRRTGLRGSRLDLEVTEGLLLEDSGEVLQTMHGLRALGVHMTLDDFGTAYASLSALRRFPFDRLKIDRSFIHDICVDSGTLAIVEAVLSLSDRIGVDVVAEGVETEAELAVLQQLGCRLVQGYLTGRPMPGPKARSLPHVARP